MRKVISLAVWLGAAVAGVAALVRWGRSWGSTPDERTMRLPGDAYLEGGPEARTAMTRAISIGAPPEVVWPWLAQMGRGAGWYSYDRLDNGGKTSACHIVSWIPPPQVGDASAIGWLRHLEPLRAITWSFPGQTTAFGVTMRGVFDFRLDREGTGSRLIMRVSNDATGSLGALVIRGFEPVDSIMATRQLRGIKTRAEVFGARTANPAVPETGARDQYQLYETIWSSGGRAGVAGQENAALWRQDAEAAGVVNPWSENPSVAPAHPSGQSL